jgi:hypothetical protein
MVKAHNCGQKKINNIPSKARATIPKQVSRQQAKAFQQELLEEFLGQLTHKELVAILCGPYNMILVHEAVMHALICGQQHSNKVSILLRHGWRMLRCRSSIAPCEAYTIMICRPNLEACSWVFTALHAFSTSAVALVHRTVVLSSQEGATAELDVSFRFFQVDLPLKKGSGPTRRPK